MLDKCVDQSHTLPETIFSASPHHPVAITISEVPRLKGMRLAFRSMLDWGSYKGCLADHICFRVRVVHRYKKILICAIIYVTGNIASVHNCNEKTCYWKWLVNRIYGLPGWTRQMYRRHTGSYSKG